MIKLHVFLIAILIVAILFISIISNCNAAPNPITDNMSDDSFERRNEYFYRFEDHPYWNAFLRPLKRKLLMHDLWEKRLSSVRGLDFKLRQAWSSNDKPFNQH
ncbi:hypothetical protein PVAND_006061 [Polypedilum vanderplanki]|uniref:Uncharacterized protein n=1 Tax=Polypedilum vanderplanki TaxID=319348 RepID=A0A9J6C206_POLVA|nr:hypothetical protein PVAND_006061 [Polypedilum vanderplanki]